MVKISDYMMIDEAAEFIGVTPKCLRDWDKKGKIKAYRNPMNKYRLYLKEDLKALLESIKPIE